MADTRSMITGFDGGDPGSPPSDAKGSLGIGAIIGLGAASLLGSVFSAIFSNEANKNLVEKQNQESLAQWNRENAYNNPSAQMSRLAAAGLNPNLMYGNGTGSLLSAPSPELHAAHNNPVVDIDPLTAAQIANINADTEQKRDSNRRANELQPYSIKQALVDIDKTINQVSVFKSEVSLNKTKEYLNNCLGKEAATKALENYENFRYLNQSLEDRLKIVRETARKYGYEANKTKIELDYLKPTLVQQLKNLQATHELIVQHARYYDEQATYHFSEVVTDRMNAKSAVERNAIRLKDVQGQIDRWDDMTLNERLKLADEYIDLGHEIYSGHTVTETVENTTGGGKPSKSKKVYKRKRMPKKGVNKPMKIMKKPVFVPM